MICLMSNTTKPPCCREAALLYAGKIGLPDEEVDAWWDYHESKGWKVGRVRMMSYEASLRTWFRNWRKFETEKLSRNLEHSLRTNGKTPLREKLANEDRERLNKLMREL